jgi:chromosome segregation ATPase
METKNMTKKELAALGFNAATIRATFRNDVYSFDDEYKEESIKALSQKTIPLAAAVDMVECILAAVEERLGNAGELDLRGFQEGALKVRRSNYKSILSALKKADTELMKEADAKAEPAEKPVDAERAADLNALAEMRTEVDRLTCLASEADKRVEAVEVALQDSEARRAAMTAELTKTRDRLMAALDTVSAMKAQRDEAEAKVIALVKPTIDDLTATLESCADLLADPCPTQKRAERLREHVLAAIAKAKGE